MLERAICTLTEICSANDDCAVRLNQIEEQIEGSSRMEGSRALRLRMEECLHTLREHCRHQREEMILHRRPDPACILQSLAIESSG